MKVEDQQKPLYFESIFGLTKILFDQDLNEIWERKPFPKTSIKNKSDYSKDKSLQLN